MSRRVDKDLILDIEESLSRLQNYTTSIDYASFLKDKKTQDAVIRNLEVLGEATKKLSEDFRLKNDHIPWKKIAGTRDRLIHDYFGINIDIIWKIVIEELPKLSSQINELHENQ